MKFTLYCLIAPAVLFVCTIGAPGLRAQSAQGYVGNGHNAQDPAAMAIVKASDAADYATTQLIRAALSADTSLSADARGVKILTLSGRVTIAGPVASDSEKSEVMAKAISVVGAFDVANQMYVPVTTDSFIFNQPPAA